jgi:DNA invertase Pin-like site-specific DNA recombinase
LVFAILAAVAEMERDLTAERVKEGMRLARAKGVKLGRPRLTESSAFTRRWLEVRASLLSGELSQRKAAEELRVGGTTIRRLLLATSEAEASKDVVRSTP